MNKEQIKKALEEARANAKKRNFSQTFDLIINLKQLDLKKPDHKINTFITLPHSRGKTPKICGLVGEQSLTEAKANFDLAILKEDFPTYSKDKNKAKKLATEYDFFVAQANIMPDIATHFGKVLGSRGKMPNPKAGCIVPPKIPLKPIKEKLNKLVHAQTKNEISIKTMIGNESMSDDEITENIMKVYNEVLHLLPLHEQNLKNVLLKLTMGKPAIVGGKNE